MARTIIPITHCNPQSVANEFTGDAKKALTMLKNNGDVFVINSLESLAYITNPDCTVFYVPNTKIMPYANTIKHATA